MEINESQNERQIEGNKKGISFWLILVILAIIVMAGIIINQEYQKRGWTEDKLCSRWVKMPNTDINITDCNIPDIDLMCNATTSKLNTEVKDCICDDNKNRIQIYCANKQSVWRYTL